MLMLSILFICLLLVTYVMSFNKRILLCLGFAIITTCVGCSNSSFLNSKEKIEKINYGWHVEYMELEKLHQYSTGKTQKIALIDSGISGFQLVKDNSLFVENVKNGKDKYGHGTSMYSILKGYKNEVLGISPDVDVISINVVNEKGEIEPESMAEAIQKAIDSQCTIINLSLGTYEENQAVSKKIDLAIESGILIVASAGDYGTTDLMFPASKNGVISVGSLDKTGDISDFTNSPEDTLVNFPGEDIKVINHKQVVNETSGTSQAAAIASGYLALLMDYSIQQEKRLEYEDIKKIFENEDNLVNIFKSIKNK